MDAHNAQATRQKTLGTGIYDPSLTAEYEDEPFGVTDDRGSSRVVHPAGKMQAGFDLSQPGKRRFESFLEKFNLPAEPTVVECYPEDEDIERPVFAWANHKFVVVTGANPLTGEHGYPHTDGEIGSTSYVGFEGGPSPVKQAFNHFKPITKANGEIGTRGYI